MTREAYDQVNNWQPHQAKLTHELIAGAAGYEAMKAWNEHQQKQGVDVSHAKAKEILAGAATALIDRLIETKGLDALDKHKLKQEAEKHYEHHYKN